MTANSNGVYVVGLLYSAGETPVNHAAHFDGSRWTAMDEGLSPGNSQLISNVGTNLYLAEQEQYSYVVLKRWNGSEWLPIPGGFTNIYGWGGSATHLAASQTNLFVAGYFTGVGTEAATNLVRWDGNQWHSLNFVPLRPDNGDGISSMATRGETLFVAEHYRSPLGPLGGDPIPATNSIRHWDGTNWWDIGASIKFGGENDYVSQIVCMESNLFVGGRFVATNPIPATNLMRWDGNSWQAVNWPFGSNSSFSSMAVSGTNLYVRGWFGDTNTFPPVEITKWDGTKWSGLGSGLRSGGLVGRPGLIGVGAASDLVAVGREVYCWGRFTSAGGKPSYQFAIWHEFPTVSLLPRGWLPNGHFGLSILGSSGQTVKIQSSPDLEDWTNLGSHTPDSDDYEIEDDTANGNMVRFYRALLVP